MKDLARVPVAVLAIWLILPTSVQAQDRTGFGISAGIGASQIRDKDGDAEFSAGDIGWTLEFEYRFTPNFALGLGGFSLGRANDDFGGVDTEIAVRGWNVFGRTIVEVSENVEAFGRIGVANYFVDIDPGSVSFDDALFGQGAIELGVGFDIGRRDKLAFRVEGRYFDGDNDESGLLFTVGINYLF